MTHRTLTGLSDQGLSCLSKLGITVTNVSVRNLFKAAGKRCGQLLFHIKNCIDNKKDVLLDEVCNLNDSLFPGMVKHPPLTSTNALFMAI